jgi:hypothetical protein
VEVLYLFNDNNNDNINTDKWWDLANAVVNQEMWEFLDHVKNYQLLSVSAEWI